MGPHHCHRRTHWNPRPSHIASQWQWCTVLETWVLWGFSRRAQGNKNFTKTFLGKSYVQNWFKLGEIARAGCFSRGGGLISRPLNVTRIRPMAHTMRSFQTHRPFKNQSEPGLRAIQSILGPLSFIRVDSKWTHERIHNFRHLECWSTLCAWGTPLQSTHGCRSVFWIGFNLAQKGKLGVPIPRTCP